MILLACATRVEAEPFIEYHRLVKRNTGSGYDIYGGGAVSLIITGMGTLKGALYLSEILQQRKADGHPVAQVINYGVAGSVCDRFSLGEVVMVDRVIKYDPVEFVKPRPGRHFSSSFPDITLTPKRRDTTILATSDHPVFSEDDAKKVSLHAHVVDMEGYGYACAARRHGIPLEIVKGISDCARKESEQSFKNTVADVLVKLLSFHSRRQAP